MALTVSLGLAGETPADVLMKRCGAVLIVGERALAGCAGGLAVYREVPGPPAGRLVLPGGTLDLLSTRRGLLACLGPAGLARAEIGADDTPRRLAMLELPGAAYQAARRGPRDIAVALGELGIAFVHVKSSGRLELGGSLDLHERVVGIAAPRPDRLLAAAGGGGLIDLRLEEGAWSEVGRLPATDARELLLLEENGGSPLAVLADGAGGVALIAIDEAGPRELDRLPPLGLDRVRGVAATTRAAAAPPGSAAQSGSPSRPAPGPADRPSREGQTWIATAEGSSGARLLRLGPGPRLEELRRWTGLGGSVTDAAFDGRSLLLASDREGLLRLDLAPEEEASAPPPAGSAAPAAPRAAGRVSPRPRPGGGS